MLRYALFWVIAAAAAAQPSIVNAKLETRSAASGLEPAFRSIVDRSGGPAWIGYSVPAIDRSERGCNNDGRCYLEQERPADKQRRPAAKLEGSGRMAVLIRVEAKQTGQVRVYSDTCELDAGGLPVYWLRDVRPDQSVELMAGLVRAGDGRARDGAVLAIA
ncbi:MAG TPA: hypothetical protein VHA11_00435, partial [Bryobacteraceae bacterium]|nr:hypothetical protein [Bryobacteraceae bacterium]